MPSHGHLAGARQLEWEDLFRGPGSSLLKDRGDLEKMFAERVRPGDEVVTYCWVGYRASATWLVARWLGYEAKLYDGSYQDWSQRKLPVSKPASR
jgi:thiosulfate/3-mercaptopyruvate sulfurtransferase